VDIFVPSINGSTGAYVAARVDHGGCDSPSDVGIFFFVFPATNRFLVTLDLGMTLYIHYISKVKSSLVFKTSC